MSLLDKVIGAFSLGKGASPKVPGIAVGTFAATKPGMSAIRVANRVLEREPSILASDNPQHQMVKLIAEEVVREMIENGYIQVCILPQQLQVVTTGASPSGPVTTFGGNVTPLTLIGIMR